MQLRRNMSTREQLKNTWAFAASPKHIGLRSTYKSLRSRNQCVITACSKEAKKLGVQAGMRYEDARAVLPELRILVYGQGASYGKR